MVITATILLLKHYAQEHNQTAVSLGFSGCSSLYRISIMGVLYCYYHLFNQNFTGQHDNVQSTSFPMYVSKSLTCPKYSRKFPPCSFFLQIISNYYLGSLASFSTWCTSQKSLFSVAKHILCYYLPIIIFSVEYSANFLLRI